MATQDSPLDALTDQDYEQIVRQTIQQQTGASATDLSNVRVSETEVTKRSGTHGYLGTYYKLVIKIVATQFSDDTSFVYFVKTLPLSNAALMKLMRETGMADREHRSYLALLPQLDAVPRLRPSKNVLHI